jgi:hypothetical protein
VLPHKGRKTEAANLETVAILLPFVFMGCGSDDTDRSAKTETGTAAKQPSPGQKNSRVVYGPQAPVGFVSLS